MYSSNKQLDFEQQYSPSLYTKRFQSHPKPNEEVIKHFINVSREATTLARRLYKTRLDVRYGGENDNQLLDIYFKEQEEGSPIFVYIHGGFWQLLDKSTSGPVVHPLIEQNYRILLIDYNLCPDVSLQQLTEQISNFYKWLKTYAEKTNAPKISICGHSAGAHLAVQMFKEEFLKPLYRLNLIEHIFLISGLYDLRELWSLTSCNPNNILNLNAEKAKQLSPLCWSYSPDIVEEYQKQDLKIHVLIAENDSPTFQKQSFDFAQVLIALNFKVEIQMFTSYDHFDIIEECVNKKSAISSYLWKYLNLIK